MYYLLLAILLVSSVLLVILVLMQSGKGGGLSGAFGAGGGESSLFGAGTATVIMKATGVLATVFMISCIAVAAIQRHQSKPRFPKGIEEELDRAASEGAGTAGIEGEEEGKEAAEGEECRRRGIPDADAARRPGGVGVAGFISAGSDRSSLRIGEPMALRKQREGTTARWQLDRASTGLPLSAIRV